MRTFFTGVILIIANFCTAQNLVADSSFEIMMNCPTTFGQIFCPLTPPGWPQTLTHWFSAAPNSPDYYNSCSTDPTSTQPNNFYGNYPPHTGQGYAGIVAYGGFPANGPATSYREYIETQLTQPLAAGQKYTISMWVNFAFHPSTGSFGNVMAVNRLDVHFSTTMLLNMSAPLSGIVVAVQTQPATFLTDTSQWVRITGEYTAIGGEQFMTIGTFNNGVLPPLQQHVPSPPIIGASVLSYYMIDDVALYPKPVIPCDTIRITQDTLLCTVAPIELQPMATSASYHWSTGATSQYISVNTSGTYWRLATDGCNATIDTFDVQYFNGTTITSHDTSLCASQQSITLQGYPGADSYQWNNGANTPSATIQEAGTYYCIAIANCTLHIDTFHVAPYSTTAHTTDTTLCFPVSVLLTSIDNADKYEWSNGKTTASITVTAQGIYTCRAHKDCDVFTYSYTLNNKAKVVDVTLGNDTTICKEDKIGIGTGNADIISYLWSTGETTCCITPQQTGTYYLQANNGCTTLSDSINLELVSCEDCIFIPSAFTPNNDGKNDALSVIAKCPLQNFHLIIANRFGEIVHESSDITARWDGRFKGAPCDVGVYYYMIQYTAAGDGEEHLLKGDITLIY